MICEVCGKHVNEGFRVRLEGGFVLACSGCAALGEVVEVASTKKPIKTVPAAVTPEDFEVDAEYELVDGFGGKVKERREKLGLTQEELGKMLNETASIIHRIELGRFEPSVDFARMLERKLRVRLLAPADKEVAPQAKAGDTGELTLGDTVVVRKRGK